MDVNFVDKTKCWLQDDGGDDRGAAGEADHGSARWRRSGRGGGGRRDGENKMRFFKIKEDQQKLNFIRSGT